jgi:aspartate/methionine/tyrosine aminotransferase
MQPFALERYFSQYEFNTKYILSASDCEPLTMAELLAMADGESRRLWDTLKLSYTETLGYPRLRDEISQLYKDVKADQILVAAPEELIFLAMNSLLSKGDEVIVTSPAYQSLHDIATSLGCKVHRWDLIPTESGWTLDMQFLYDHASNRIRLIIINFPHNPTGHHISRHEQQAIVDIARKHNILIFSDEMYRGAEYTPEVQLPAMADMYERGISLWGLSKSFALPGLRIGWLAARDPQFISKCLQLRDYITICNSAPSEILALIALRSAGKILQRTRDTILRNLAIADKFFVRHKKDFAWLRPSAGPVAFPILRKNIGVEEFCRNLIGRKSLLITPGTLFQHSGNHFRIGLGRLSFEEAIAFLDKSL